MAYIYILKENPDGDGKNGPLFLPVAKIRCKESFLNFFDMNYGSLSFQDELNRTDMTGKHFHTVKFTKKWIMNWFKLNEFGVGQDKRKWVQASISFAKNRLIPFLSKTKSSLYVDVVTD